MVETRDHFTKRLDMLGRKKKRMTQGYITKVDKNGLLVVESKPQRRFGGAGLLKIVMMALLGFFGFKVFTLSAVGPVTYNERLSELQNGTVVEQLGAKALAIDPVTEAVANSVGPVLR